MKESKNRLLSLLLALVLLLTSLPINALAARGDQVKEAPAREVIEPTKIVERDGKLYKAYSLEDLGIKDFKPWEKGKPGSYFRAAGDVSPTYMYVDNRVGYRLHMHFPEGEQVELWSLGEDMYGADDKLMGLATIPASVNDTDNLVKIFFVETEDYDQSIANSSQSYIMLPLITQYSINFQKDELEDTEIYLTLTPRTHGLYGVNWFTNKLTRPELHPYINRRMPGFQITLPKEDTPENSYHSISNLKLKEEYLNGEKINVLSRGAISPDDFTISDFNGAVSAVAGWDHGANRTDDLIRHSYLYVGQDGTEYIWHPEKKAYFNKDGQEVDLPQDAKDKYFVDLTGNFEFPFMFYIRDALKVQFNTGAGALAGVSSEDAKKAENQKQNIPVTVDGKKVDFQEIGHSEGFSNYLTDNEIVEVGYGEYVNREISLKGRQIVSPQLDKDFQAPANKVFAGWAEKPDAELRDVIDTGTYKFTKETTTLYAVYIDKDEYALVTTKGYPYSDPKTDAALKDPAANKAQSETWEENAGTKQATFENLIESATSLLTEEANPDNPDFAKHYTLVWRDKDGNRLEKDSMVDVKSTITADIIHSKVQVKGAAGEGTSAQTGLEDERPFVIQAVTDAYTSEDPKNIFGPVDDGVAEVGDINALNTELTKQINTEEGYTLVGFANKEAEGDSKWITDLYDVKNLPKEDFTATAIAVKDPVPATDVVFQKGDKDTKDSKLVDRLVGNENELQSIKQILGLDPEEKVQISLKDGSTIDTSTPTKEGETRQATVVVTYGNGPGETPVTKEITVNYTVAESYVTLTTDTDDATNAPLVDSKNNTQDVVKGSNWTDTVEETAAGHLKVSEGYSIVSWRVDGKDVTKDTTFNEDTTITAHVVKDILEPGETPKSGDEKYYTKVTFDAKEGLFDKDGTKISKIDVYALPSAKLEDVVNKMKGSEPTSNKTGFEFEKWTEGLDIEGNPKDLVLGEDPNKTEVGENSRTIDANYTDKTQYFDVTYDKGQSEDGTEATGEVPAPFKVAKDGKVTLKDKGDLELTDYTFTGWEVKTGDKTETKQPGQTITITGDTTITAQWTKNDEIVELTYKAEAVEGVDPTGTAPAKQATKKGENLIVQGKGDLALKDYEFTGWTDGTTTYQPGDTITMDSNVELTPKWTKNTETFDITYNKGQSEEGTIPTGQVPDPFKVEKDGSLTLKDKGDLELTDYTFTGWEVKTGDKTETKQPGQTITITGDTTITAQWTKNDEIVTLTYKAGEIEGNPVTADMPQAENVVKDGKVTLKAFEGKEPDKYKFTGWKIGDTTYAPGQSVNVGADAEAIAQWEKEIDTYTIKYLPGDGASGQAPSDQAVKQGETTVVQNQGQLTKSGFDFIGWKDQDGNDYNPGSTITPTGNVTLTAQWEATIVPLKDFKVSFDVGNTAETPEAEKATEVPDQTVKENSQVVEPKEPTKPGYTFKGWQDKDGNDYNFSTPVKEELTLKAVWEKNPEPAKEYTVTFDPAGGTPEPEDQKVTEGNKVIKPESPTKTKEGKTFAFDGWFEVSEDGTLAQTAFDFATAPTGDSRTIKLKAKWTEVKPDQVTLTYKSGADEVTENIPAQVTKNKGETVTVADSNMTREGYSFLYWKDEGEEGKEVFYNPGSQITLNENRTLTGVWKETEKPLAKHTVTFDVDGDTTVVPAQTVTDGEKAIEPKSPVKDGFTFEGWKLSTETGDTAYNFGTEVKGDITLVAIWKAIPEEAKVTLSYDLGGAQGDVPEAKKVAKGTDVEVAGIGEVTKTGYSFKYWKTGEEGKEVYYNPGSVIRMTKDTTLTAVWELTIIPKAKHTVTFDVDGNTTLVPAQTVTDGEKAIEPKSPEKAGFKFTGWKNGEEAYDFTKEVKGDLTLTAAFEQIPVTEQVKVTYTGGQGTSGENPADQIVAKGDKVVLRNQNTLTKEGNDFIGWVDAKGNKYNVGQEITLNEDLALTAEWKETEQPLAKHTVTFDVDGNTTLVPAQTVTDGEKAIEPKSPEKAGFKFTGWKNGEEAYDFKSEVKGDLTLTAAFEEIPVTEQVKVTYTGGQGTSGENPADQIVAKGDKVVLRNQNTLTK